MQTVAVFTGDLVGSTNLTKAQIDAAFVALENCAKQAEEWCGTPLNFTRHRGDGWQIMLQQPKYVLRLAIIFRATLKALGNDFDTYIGIAKGQADTSTNTDLNTRNDQVFINSGGQLEDVKSLSTLGCRMTYLGNAAETTAIALADKIVSDWTPAQSDAVVQMLNDLTNEMTYTELAEKLKKSRQTVTKTLNAAGFSTINLALKYWENMDD